MRRRIADGRKPHHPRALGASGQVLSDGGYVEVRKGYVGKRPRTWINLSPTGRAALSAHIAALQEIATRVGRPDSTPVPEQSG
ncbi:transcriptional regulator [Micromonospora sp. NPDC048898]|uniref:transcriptional regulator n=1 Tax=Micromonospora sp. NPDC048898 TaxID=3364260 RepID=UPI003716D282